MPQRLNTWASLGGSPPPPGSTGLYPPAVLDPNRRELTRAPMRLADRGVPIGGASEHGVSEAIYLRDPDGNGLEISRDRDPAEWPREADGTLSMTLARHAPSPQSGARERTTAVRPARMTSRPKPK